jgi:hypothetical protein
MIFWLKNAVYKMVESIQLLKNAVGTQESVKMREAFGIHENHVVSLMRAP